MNCELTILSDKVDSFTASLKTSFTSFAGCEKSNVEVLQKSIAFLRNELSAKDQIISSLLETQTTTLNKLAEQKHERNDKHHATSPRESNKNLSPDFLQQ